MTLNNMKSNIPFKFKIRPTNPSSMKLHSLSLNDYSIAVRLFMSKIRPSVPYYRRVCPHPNISPNSDFFRQISVFNNSF